MGVPGNFKFNFSSPAAPQVWAILDRGGGSWRSSPRRRTTSCSPSPSPEHHDEDEHEHEYGGFWSFNAFGLYFFKGKIFCPFFWQKVYYGAMELGACYAFLFFLYKGIAKDSYRVAMEHVDHFCVLFFYLKISKYCYRGAMEHVEQVFQ